MLALDEVKAMVLKNGAIAQQRSPEQWGEFFLKKRAEFTALAKRLRSHPRIVGESRDVDFDLGVAGIVFSCRAVVAIDGATLDHPQEPDDDEQRRAVDDEIVHQLPRITKSTSTSSATSSSHSSTSSLFTSISSISSQSSLHNHNAIQQQNSTINKSYSGNDNESDTGISSANSEDFSTQQLETLV